MLHLSPSLHSLTLGRKNPMPRDKPTPRTYDSPRLVRVQRKEITQRLRTIGKWAHQSRAARPKGSLLNS